MVELEGESVVFFKVRPKYVVTTLEELRKNPNVRYTALATGHYDIVLTAAFGDYESLWKFAETYSASENIEMVSTHPTFKYWMRQRPTEKPIIGWTLIQTSNQERTFKELQKVPGVDRLCSTSGPYNLIACIRGSDIGDLHSTITERVHKLYGVKRTETLTSKPTP